MTGNSDQLSAKVIKEILQMITAGGRFASGDKLPNEHELSQELGISRTTLREAIKVLASQGYLEIKRGKGTYVAYSTQMDDGIILPDLKAPRVNVKDLYEVRLIFEPQAAYYATKRATDGELNQIETYCRDNEKMIKRQDDDWNKTELMFHNAIAESTKNAFFRTLLPTFNSAIHQGVILAKGDEKVAQDTLRDHRKVVEFMKKRNAEGARLAMHLHIINTMSAFGVPID